MKMFVSRVCLWIFSAYYDVIQPDKMLLRLSFQKLGEFCYQRWPDADILSVPSVINVILTRVPLAIARVIADRKLFLLDLA